MKLYSYQLSLAAIVFQLVLANLATLSIGFWGYPTVFVCAFFCWLMIRDLPQQFQLYKCLKAEDYAITRNYDRESVENLLAEHKKLEELT